MTMPRRAGFLADLVARLRADNAIDALVVDRIYSHPPQDVDMPFVLLRISDDAFDTSTDDGLQFSIAVDIWDDRPTEANVLLIADAITDSLHDAQFSLTSGFLTLMRYQRGSSSIEADGLAHHYAMTFLALVTAT